MWPIQVEGIPQAIFNPTLSIRSRARVTDDGPSAGVWGEDPVKLTLALKMTRQDLTRTQMELNTMKANFGDVVPRRDFEMQEKTNMELQEQVLGGQVELDMVGYGQAGG